MIEEPIRVLHIVTHMERGGLETMIMNYYRNIDRSKVQFDFLTHRDTNASYNDEILSLGGKIYSLPPLNPFSRKYIRALDDFFKNHKEYHIVHSHLNAMSTIPLKYAKKNGVKFTIAHSHTSNQEKNLKYFIKYFSKKFITKYADELFACGNKAGKWLFGTKDFMILNNAIDVDKYTYDSKKAKEVRSKLGLDDEFVIGHVGRFCTPKNHEFIIDIFNEVQKIEPNSKLVLVGEGELKDKIANKVISLGLDKKVEFLGLRSDVNDLMQVMDVFLFPSLYEGLPVTMVEAQSSGLKCFISNTVPKDCILTDNVKVIDLGKNSNIWAEEIVKYKNYTRENTKKQIEKANFDIKENSKWLQNFYLENN